MLHIQSKIGGRSENQDSYGSTLTPFGELIIVCDGMGGHVGGRQASELAVQTIIQQLTTSTNASPERALTLAIETANAEIFRKSASDISLKGMGTTVVALLICPEKAIACHVGDSRIYQIRGGEILFRTNDHSHVFELVKAGLMTEEEARVSSQSNIITRALGIQPNVEIEINASIHYQQGDRFLLCTDGIWGVVPESELIEMVSLPSDLETTLTHMTEKIDAIGQAKSMKQDNLTAGMVEV